MKRSLLVLCLALALVAALAACGSSNDNSGGGTSASTPSGGGNTDAAALFADNCAGCHGSDGSGGFGPDLRNETDSAKVSSQIQNGGDKMPAFGDKLTADQIQALTSYVTDQL
jgi:mono/diheme cytochrome c family protein